MATDTNERVGNSNGEQQGGKGPGRIRRLLPGVKKKSVSEQMLGEAVVEQPFAGGAKWPVRDLQEIHGLRAFMGYSHIADRNRIVRMDGKRVAVFQVKGKEVEQRLITSYAGALNSLSEHVQFLIRQHPPRLNSYRLKLRSERVDRLSQTMEEAAESVDVLLGDMEAPGRAYGPTLLHRYTRGLHRGRCRSFGEGAINDCNAYREGVGHFSC